MPFSLPSCYPLLLLDPNHLFTEPRASWDVPFPLQVQAPGWPRGLPSHRAAAPAGLPGAFLQAPVPVPLPSQPPPALSSGTSWPQHSWRQKGCIDVWARSPLLAGRVFFFYFFELKDLILIRKGLNREDSPPTHSRSSQVAPRRQEAGTSRLGSPPPHAATCL